MSRWGVAAVLLVSLCAQGQTQELDIDYTSMTAREILKHAIENEQNIGDIRGEFYASTSFDVDDDNPDIQHTAFILLGDGRYSYRPLTEDSWLLSGSFDGKTAATFDGVEFLQAVDAPSEIGEMAYVFPVEAATDEEHFLSFDLRYGLFEVENNLRPASWTAGYLENEHISRIEGPQNTVSLSWTDYDGYETIARFSIYHKLALVEFESKSDDGMHAKVVYSEFVQSPSGRWFATNIQSEMHFGDGDGMFESRQFRNLEFDFDVPPKMIDTTSRVDAAAFTIDLRTLPGLFRYWMSKSDFSDPEMISYALSDFVEYFSGVIIGTFVLLMLSLVIATIGVVYAVKRKKPKGVSA